MKKLIILVAIVLLMINCGVDQKKHDLLESKYQKKSNDYKELEKNMSTLKKELASEKTNSKDLKERLDVFLMSPEVLYETAQEEYKIKSYYSAKRGFGVLIKTHPKSKEARLAKNKIKTLDILIKKREKKEAIERKKAEKSRIYKALREGSDLELKSWNWSVEHGYATIKGIVKNLSGKNLKNVQAVVSIFDKQGVFITSTTALIEYNPIMPGQTSPFTAMITSNPRMSSARVEFKFLMGGTIRHFQKPK